jgi:hypothetical protein
MLLILLWLDGDDWRRRPLVGRKQELAQLIVRQKGSLLYVDHLVEQGRSLYEAAWGLHWKGSSRSEGQPICEHANAELAEDQEPRL